VKNLERVQGDERDAIILTVGYGKSATGAMQYRFGPINQQGGERRLNVAITRARAQMTVVSAFLPTDLDPARLKSEGAQMLGATWRMPPPVVLISARCDASVRRSTRSSPTCAIVCRPPVSPSQRSSEYPGTGSISPRATPSVGASTCWRSKPTAPATTAAQRHESATACARSTRAPRMALPQDLVE